jgi:hypothetical protein
MESASENSNNVGKTVYEMQRDENIVENNEMLASLGLTPINMCNEPWKRAKVSSYINCSSIMTLLI